MFSSLAIGRYDSDVQRAFLRAMIDRANASILANVMGLAILGYACFVLPFGRTLGIAVGARLVAVVITGWNTRALLGALEADRPVTGHVNRFALGMGLAGLTWGGLIWSVPIAHLTSMGGLLVMTVILTGVSLIIATASPVPRVIAVFMAGFAGPMIAWLVLVSSSMGMGPVITILAIAFAVLSFSLGLTREAQKAGRLIVENRNLVEAHARLIADLKRAAEENERLANHDALTGLLNRRAFERVVTDIGATGRTHLWSAMLVDLDHFKRVNDSAGHAAGDGVLVASGAILAGTVAALPGGGIAARLGGEEFVLMVEGLRDAEVLDAARQVGARFRALPAPEGVEQAVTASIGLARWAEGETWEQCFARADAALYAAKNAGRDRVVAAGGTDDLAYRPPRLPEARSDAAA